VKTGAHPFRRKLPALAAGLFLLLFTAVAVWLARDFINNAGKPKKPRVQQISLVKPPPPKPEEKPPEPKKVEPPKEEVKIDQPQTPPPDSAPAPNPGGIPDGPPGGMATDLAAGSGTGIIGGGSREDWYGRLISRHLEDVLRRSKRLQGASYRVTVNVWFDGNGIERVQLVQGSGNAQTDDLLRQELLALPPLREAIPSDMPQPVRIRVASRS
jgi:protein TonB